MNADVHHFTNEIESFRLEVPDTALRRLWLRLGRARQLGEAWDASAAFGASPVWVSELLDGWLDDFDYRQAEERLNALGLQSLGRGVGQVVFAVRRSPAVGAIPLLLLTETPPDEQALLAPLTDPRGSAPPADMAFHVVVPLELGSSAAGPEARAEAYAALMAELGFSRYVVHGSGRDARVAQWLLHCDAEHVAAAHVTRLVAFPSEDALELAQLDPREKSQLALLRELDAEQRFNAPESPLEELAGMLAKLADSAENSRLRADVLLTSLTLRALAPGPLGAEPHARLATGVSSNVPVAVSSFPLDAPTLRRFAERHQRVVRWTEHETGGPLPELEQPELLLGELRSFFACVA